ncbi:hypothetical protein FOMPIDRAFT_1063114 [Fomitopsis schrenkii]|uniref:Uncharacterized protein n=1 Tax=Fomitopsis schrenkii TaxID=2126942 RepID=S8DTT5_FOMSC|nr:hypothetical protein FOMPIDRAFT_1063114 [Fomitopsis schrenkii]
MPHGDHARSWKTELQGPRARKATPAREQGRHPQPLTPVLQMTYDEPDSTSSSEGECIALIDSPPSESKTTEVVDEVQSGSENPVSQCTSVELYEVVPSKDDYLHDYMFVGSYDENEDNEGGDTSSRYYNALAEDIGAELGWNHNLVFSGGEPKLAQEVAQIRLESCITLSFDLGASLAPVSEEAGSSQCLKEHLLACGTSSPMSAYIYYLGFLEHVFHATARILGRLQEESGSANGALELWPAEMADPRSRRDLQRKIVRAHANAVREDLQEFPELAFKDPDVDVAENLAFQAFRRLSTVLPLYLQQSRRRTIPTVILVFQGVDALATRAFGDRTCDLLQPHTPTTPLRPYTLLDLLFVALRLFSEDGLRAIFHFRETDVLEGILRDSLDTPVPTQSWRPRRNRWPPLSSRAYSSAIKAQRLGKESPSSVSDPVDEDLFGPIYATQASSSNTPPPMSQTFSEATSSQPPSTPSSAIGAYQRHVMATFPG